MKKDTREALVLILAFLVPLAPCVQVRADFYMDPMNVFRKSPSNNGPVAITGVDIFEKYEVATGSALLQVWDEKNAIFFASGISPFEPSMYDNIIVFAEMDDEEYDILGIDFVNEDVDKDICTATGDQQVPKIYDKTVVWQDRRNDNWDIYGADITDLNNPAEFPICTNADEQAHPDIFEGIVVWEDWAYSSNPEDGLQGKDLNSGQEFSVCDIIRSENEARIPCYPAIYENTVIWAEVGFVGDLEGNPNELAKKVNICAANISDQNNVSEYIVDSWNIDANFYEDYWYDLFSIISEFVYPPAIYESTVVYVKSIDDNYTVMVADISNPNKIAKSEITPYMNLISFNPNSLAIYGNTLVWIDGTYSISNIILPGLVHKLGQDRTSALASDPVNTATGNFYLHETDLTIAGPGMNFEFTRAYNAQDSYLGPFGPGWTHSYNIFVAPDPCSEMMLVKCGDGQGHYYLPTAGDPNSYHPVIGAVYDGLKKNLDNTWTVTQKDLTQYTFNTAGKLTSIIDKNGNTVSLSYDANGLDRITDTAGRLIDFNCDANGLVLSLTDPNNRQFIYGYTAGKLTSVADPRGNSTYYSYDVSNGMLKTITNNRGIVDVNNVYDANDKVIQQINGRGKVSSFFYNDPNENQTTITDPLGRQTIHTYDPYLRLISITDPCDKTISYTYDNKSNRTSITHQNGNTRYFTYDDMGNVLTMKAPQTNPGDPSTAAVTTITYDANNNPLTKTEATGSSLQKAWTYEYNPNGNLARTVDPNNKESLRTYTIKGLLATETDKKGNVTKYSYDSNGNLTDVNDALGNVTHYTYDTVGRMLTKTNARGNTTTYSYDKNDNLLTETDPNGKPITYSYDENNNKTSMTDRRDNSWTYQYNENDILYREVDANGFEILYSYDDVDNRTLVTDKRGKVTHYTYNALNRLVDVNDPLGHHISYTYDPKGNRISQTNGLDKTWVYEYDALDRLIKETDPLGNSTKYEYDLLGRKTAVTDARDNKTQYEYDVLDRLVKVIDAIGGITEYEYDPVGNLISIIDANEKLSTRDYDALDRLIAESDPLGNTTEYQYDEVGNCTLKNDATDRNTVYAYDVLDRLLNVSYPDSNQVTYSYDENSNRIAMTDWNGSSSYEYDKLNRMTTSADAFGNKVEYKYDAIGNRTTIVYPDGNSVGYQYDDTGKLQKVTDWNNRITTYIYDTANNLKSVTLPNSSIQLYNYDDASRLISVQNKDKDSNSIGSFDYTLDAVGNRTEIEETATLSPIIQYSDANYSYDDSDMLIAGGSCSYSFNNNGDQTSRDCGSLTQYTYDSKDLLVGVSESGLSIEHTYDGAGDRIAKTTNAAEKRYVLDTASSMSQVLCETDTDGNITAYYIFGVGLLSKITPDGSEYYYHYDGLGSTVALTNELGYLTDQYAYTPFGELANSQGSTENSFKYVGRFGVMTEPDGTLFMRARFYDPTTGRFLTTDPVEGGFYNPQSLHNYLYAASNPIINVDPKGTEWFTTFLSTVELVVIKVAEFVTGFSTYIPSNPFAGTAMSAGIDLAEERAEVVTNIAKETVATGKGLQDPDFYYNLGKTGQNYNREIQGRVRTASTSTVKVNEVQFAAKAGHSEAKTTGAMTLVTGKVSKPTTVTRNNTPNIRSVTSKTYSKTHTSTTRKYK